ncbi:proline dehydrogenase 1, mitochondrial-like [Tubulanus polymorphus]|uniref:proline dehydrogenase 1, mitochondrial-like n=1 Tax=Tubulanus polymorphus TaxID=672921 RepID=UPI003DA5C5B3
MASLRTASVISRKSLIVHRLYRFTGSKSSTITFFRSKADAASTSLRNESVLQTNDSNRPKAATSYCPEYEKLDLTFENETEAYKSKTTYELLRAYLTYKLCSVDYLVDNNRQILKVVRKCLGQTLFKRLMRATFYGHFVAGEDQDDIKPAINRMRHFGVKSILDYSVEEDLTKAEAKDAEMESCITSAGDAPASDENVRYRAHEEFGDRRENVTGARTYFYEDEAKCDKTMEIFLRSIDAVSGSTQSTGFAAIKLTALGRPQFLLQMSEALVEMRRLFNLISENPDGSSSQTISSDRFKQRLKELGVTVSRDDRKKWFTLLDATKDGKIDLLDWHNLLEVEMNLPRILTIKNIETDLANPGFTPMTDQEMQQMKNMLDRIDTIAKYAQKKDVRVMVDAEQTYFQPAISRFTMEMMRKYNKEKAYIFNTYQCYLKETFNNIIVDLNLSARENFYFGAKLVRGAYMEQERARAHSLGYPDPVCDNYEATSLNYANVLGKVVEHIKEREMGKIAIMVASHNEDTVRLTVEKMRENDIKPSDRVLCFGQLLGMCDQVSFPLGQAGYSVYKYVPYGPVEEVIPYLSRRALENRSVLAKVKKEEKLIVRELKNRMKSGNIIYDPFMHPPTPPI